MLLASYGNRAQQPPHHGRPGTEHKTDGGQFDDKETHTEGICCHSDQDSDSGDDDDMAGSGEAWNGRCSDAV